MPNFILSTCGTSLLTNFARLSDEYKSLGKILVENTNFRQFENFPNEIGEDLKKFILRTEWELTDADNETAARLSAEIKALLKFYGGDLTGATADFHYLLHTDTWLGGEAERIVAAWLAGRGINAQIFAPKDLQTESLEGFQIALSDIVKWCGETIDGFRQSGYRIVFNLTGGFKSTQGFLQTLGMFYADETVYIFESGRELLRIPRIPIEISAEREIQENLKIYRRLSLGLSISADEAAGLAETMRMQIGDECCLSPWAEIIWQQAKKKIYAERLWDAPSDKIRYGEKFADSLKGIEARRLIAVNEKIDALTRELETGQKLSSLDFKELKGNPLPPSTHELDAWHDQDAKRLFGHFENNTFVLDKLDKALH